MTLRRDVLATPLGEAVLITDAAGQLRGLDWADRPARLARWAAATPGPAPSGMRRALCAYFEGELAAPGAIAWHAAGTEFQQAYWALLTTIPPGETRSYASLAAQLGRPRAIRAVGAANGANPISLVLPCHRVLGADGGLTGYGGGLDRKRWLLRHEGVTLAERPNRA